MDPDNAHQRDPAIRVRQLAKAFGGSPALRNVSLELREGELLALLGPNGAGKTTLVRCICGRVRPDRGEIELGGRTLPPRGGRRELGFVPQEVALYGDLTARENLEVFGRFHGVDPAELDATVEWALSWTGLADRADERARTFSGGMKRRVNIACGVLHRPRALLLDEPTVGVDPQSRERIFAMLDELRRAGTSILLTTHQLDEAEQRCDRIVIIDQGDVIAAGSLSELIQSTVGIARRVSFRITPPLPELQGFEASRADGEVVARVVDVAEELPRLLARIRDAGGTVGDVEVRAPSLHAVFIHLTGRELRE